MSKAEVEPDLGPDDDLAVLEDNDDVVFCPVANLPELFSDKSFGDQVHPFPYSVADL